MSQPSLDQNEQCLPVSADGRQAAPYPTRRILGIDFFMGSPKEALRWGMKGGLVVVPSAPVLVELDHNPVLRDAVLRADMAITDSGLMILMWRVLAGERIERVSGYEYIKLMLEEPSLRVPGAVAWVMPSAVARDRNLAWMQSCGIAHRAEDCYLAPMYSKGVVTDAALVSWLDARRPKQVVLALGGGTQERLGIYLRDTLSFRPGIHCIGAAIGFLSGDQVRIPMWADYLYLGWLVRCLSAPRMYVPRYWKAFRLVLLLIRYRDALVPLRRD